MTSLPSGKSLITFAVPSVLDTKISNVGAYVVFLESTALTSSSNLVTWTTTSSAVPPSKSLTGGHSNSKLSLDGVPNLTLFALLLSIP